MIDMGQADSSLRMRPVSDQPRMCWTRALTVAARGMGYDHYFNVPLAEDDELRKRAFELLGLTLED